MIGVVAVTVSLKRAILANELHRNGFNAASSLAVLFESILKLRAYWSFGNDNVITVKYVEGLVANKALCLKNSVTKALGFLLTKEVYVCRRANAAKLLNLIKLACIGKLLFVFNTIVKIVLNSLFTATGNYKYILCACFYCLLNKNTYCRTVNERKHLLGNSL